MSSVMRCVRRAHFLVTEVLGLQCCIHLQSQTEQPECAHGGDSKPLGLVCC